MLICISSVQLNRVGEHADPADFDFDRVTVLHENRGLAREADAAWCAGRDDVTRLQIENRRNIGNHLRDIVDEIARAAVLERLAVQSGLHGDVARIAEHIDSHHPRPEASGVAKIFPRCDLTRMELPVADASVVKGGISRYMRQGDRKSELQSLMRISYAVFCLKKKNTYINNLIYT